MQIYGYFDDPDQVQCASGRCVDGAGHSEPFDDAYAKADWTRFEAMPPCKRVNRMNAYNTYLLMEGRADK